LSFIGTSNILHRDLKPSNILMSSDFKVKICDFGLARYYRKSPHDYTDLSREEIQQKLLGVSDHRQTKKRELSSHVVSRWYRAPEIIMLERYSYNADVWSLGCIATELLLTARDNKKQN